MKVALTEGGGETFFKPKFLTAFWKKLQEMLGGGVIKLLTIEEVHYPFQRMSKQTHFMLLLSCNTEGQSEERIRKGRNSNCKILLDNSYLVELW